MESLLNKETVDKLLVLYVFVFQSESGNVWMQR